MWIAVAAEGEPEPEHPAPDLLVTAGPPTSEDLAPPDDEAEEEVEEEVETDHRRDGDDRLRGR